MKRIKCYKNGRMVSDNPCYDGVFEHLVWMAKTNKSMVSELEITENSISFIENGIKCLAVVQ